MTPRRSAFHHVSREAVRPLVGASQPGVVPQEAHGADRQHEFVLRAVGLSDVSLRAKIGLKGEGASAVLAARGLPLPAPANRWMPYRGGLIARLGNTEFLLEAPADDDWTREFRAIDAADAMHVIRSDASLLLFGERLPELLAQVCAVRFTSRLAEDRELVLTQLAGVSVLAIPFRAAPAPALRLWCDPTFAPNLWRTLATIVCELGGAPVDPAGLGELGIPCI